MKFTVRRASPGDGDVLGEIHAAAWEAAYAPFFDPEFAAEGIRSRRTRWHERVEPGPRGDTVLVAEHDGRPLALSAFKPSPGRPGLAEILSFYSHPEGWGTGIAAALMTGTLEHLRADGVARAHLWTLRDTPRSRRFYTKAGFTESGAARPYDFGDGNPLTQVEYERGC
ncbi:GNAT family N-acetyltransferase [Streptomyces amritsarensis]|uniref:GNAT family N-acetyltransferase n=1 Tax=Streptomyces amritsarensis TaxID=681158 RepID=A0ABX3G496_9ACTN|nr:GNAT family N-acetyltransferase [Streptomyces amritsarensis]OLZ68709.1 GNAT family N-acetyltransferase [Streptomyces amritsarensis]